MINRSAEIILRRIHMKSSRSFSSVTLKSLALMLHSSPVLCVLFLLFEIVLCVIPVFSAKVISQIIEYFTDIEGHSLDYLIRIVAFYIIMNVTTQILSPVRRLVHEKLSDQIARDSEMMFNSKVASLNTVQCFENNGFFNQMQLAKSGCGARLISSLQMISSLLRGGITIVLTVGYMLSIHWLIGSISLLAVIPNTFYNFWVSKNRAALFRSRTESSRRLSYFSSVLSTPTYAKEVRLFNLGQYILDKYRNLFDSEYRRIGRIRNKQCFLGILCASLGAIVNGAALILFINMALNSKTSPGSIVLYISLLPQFIGGLQMIINALMHTRDNNQYIKHFFDFLSNDFGETNGSLKLESGCEGITDIAVRNLTFHYPNAGRNAVKSLSFNIASPSLVAVVGENGSGKSTLIKLLMRLFDSSSGEILINGVPISDYDIVELRKNMSGVFQDPARFAFTIRENLSLADVRKNIAEEDMINACKRAGIMDIVERNSRGLDTILDKQFEGGTDLSSGQWQKLSLARAFLSNASVLFFDEASADLDPKAEGLFYKNIREYAKDKIAFYITHRLSGTKDADLIIVLKDGEIAEIGKHSDLMKNEGEYYHLYHSQADGYEI